MSDILRLARPADAPQLAAVINEAFAVERFFKRGDRTTAEAVERMMKDGRFLTVDDEHGVAGTVFVRPTRPYGYFGMLSIAPRSQGRGLGRRLVDAAERALADAGCTHVEIHVVNLREELPPFYAKLGYAIVGEQPFPDPAEATRACHMLVMRKPLPAGNSESG